MYTIPKFETGHNKGRNIMHELEEGKRWNDDWNDIFVNREYDKDWNYLDTFQVAERLRGNTHTVWATGRTFDEAMDLACRLIVGKEYRPIVRAKTVVIPTFEYDIGDLLPSDFHMHQINGIVMPDLFTYDNDSRMEIGKETWMGMHGRSEKDIPNKVGTLVATEGDDSIPDRIMVTYSYDDRYFTAILRKK
jgi:hypothetical protein